MSPIIYTPYTDTKNVDRATKLHPKLNVSAISLTIRCWKHEPYVYVRITQGLRTFQEQDDLYALGRTRPGKIVTNAKAGTSWHNYGLAFDVVPLDPERDGAAIWDTTRPEWKIIAEVGKELGLHQIYIKNKRGVSWLDAPHFEYHPNLDIKQAKHILTHECNGDILKFYNTVKFD